MELQNADFLVENPVNSLFLYAGHCSKVIGQLIVPENSLERLLWPMSRDCVCVMINNVQYRKEKQSCIHQFHTVAQFLE